MRAKISALINPHSRCLFDWDEGKERLDEFSQSQQSDRLSHFGRELGLDGLTFLKFGLQVSILSSRYGFAIDRRSCLGDNLRSQHLFGRVISRRQRQSRQRVEGRRKQEQADNLNRFRHRRLRNSTSLLYPFTLALSPVAVALDRFDGLRPSV